LYAILIRNSDPKAVDGTEANVQILLNAEKGAYGMKR